MERLIVNSKIELEPLKFSHAFQIFQAIDRNRKFLESWLPFVQDTKTQEDTENFIQSVTSPNSGDRDEVYVIWFENRFAGLIGLKDTDRVNMKTEIGYWITEQMMGKGVVTMSTKRLTEYVFSSSGMNRIVIRCGVGNKKSAAIPKRLGFTFEGIEREGEKHRRKFIDLEVYSLLKVECSFFVSR
ncbi:GNAT family N-acetyltransferase [uncultured Sunxiuqinia sp.]|uniref:GNAT family N-acetyltransferase n=1 Tax=uncultured Sunxiuqinia sp. TaxID=1573825 RepID=UPI002AA6E2E4|nr:GNAT family N-acetyltransferase [uncultured Sunxiuqinia sp.]